MIGMPHGSPMPEQATYNHHLPSRQHDAHAVAACLWKVGLTDVIIWLYAWRWGGREEPGLGGTGECHANFSLHTLPSMTSTQAWQISLRRGLKEGRRRNGQPSMRAPGAPPPSATPLPPRMASRAGATSSYRGEHLGLR